MAQLQLKGFFTEICPIEEIGEKKTKIQKVIFRVPGYRDDFGDQKSADELWQLIVIGNNIDKLNLLAMDIEKPKASIKVFLNGRTWYKKEDLNKTEPNYSIEAVLYEVEHLT